jgi:hypothetical protein
MEAMVENNWVELLRRRPTLNSALDAVSSMPHGPVVVNSSWNVMAHGDAREGKWRGNWRMECVASTLHLLPLMNTPRLPVVDWTHAPADLNGLVRFAERQNLVSARVPSHFKRSLLSNHLRDREGARAHTHAPTHTTNLYNIGRYYQWLSFKSNFGRPLFLYNFTLGPLKTQDFFSDSMARQSFSCNFRHTKALSTLLSFDLRI